MLNALSRVTKKFIIFILLVIVAILGAWFLFNNAEQVSLNVIGFVFPSAASGLYFCLLFLSGAALGVLISYIITFGQVRKHKKALHYARQEINKLRTAYLKD